MCKLDTPKPNRAPALTIAGHTIDWQHTMVFAVVVLIFIYMPVNTVWNIFGNTSRYLFAFITITFLASFLYSVKRHQVRMYPESILFVGWLLWTMITAVWFQDGVGSEDYSFTGGLFRYPAFGILVLIMFNCFSLSRPERIQAATFVIGTILVIFLTLLSGSLVGSSAESRLGEKVVGNSNQYAYLLLYGILGCVYFYYTSKQLHQQVVMAVLIFVFSLFMLMSGSRKAFIGEVIFFVLMCWPSLVKAVKRQPGKLVRILVIVIITFSIGAYGLLNSSMGDRLKQLSIRDFSDKTPLEQRFDGRGRFYAETFELVPKHPVMGVGLGRFKQYDKYGYTAHSDFLQIIAETGIVGFILYFSVYAVVMTRLFKAAQKSKQPDQRRVCWLLFNALVVVLIVALGRWNYDHLPTYVLLGAAGRFGANVVGLKPHPLV